MPQLECTDLPYNPLGTVVSTCLVFRQLARKDLRGGILEVSISVGATRGKNLGSE